MDPELHDWLKKVNEALVRAGIEPISMEADGTMIIYPDHGQYRWEGKIRRV